MKTKEQATADLLGAIKYFRHAINTAKNTGIPQFGIISLLPDGTKKMIMSFDCEELFADMDIALSIPADTEQDKTMAMAVQFKQEFGLKSEGE